MAKVERYMTPVFRLCFPNVFQPQAMDGGEPKFGITPVWTPAQFSEREKVLWKKLIEAVNGKVQATFGKSVKALGSQFKYGIRDGIEKEDLEGFGAGTRFASVTSKMRPGVVDLEGNPIGPDHGNADLIYPGIYARATVSIYTYDNKSKGVSLGLMNLQKIKDGARLDARTDAAEDFDGAEIDDEWLDADNGDGDGDGDDGAEVEYEF